VALGLDCWKSNAIDLTDAKVNLKMAPNPATNQLQISVSDETPVRSLGVYDISGRLVKSVADINASYYMLRRENLQDGMYIIRMQFDSGVLSKKVIFE
jgi:hypothetical protein